MSSIRKPKHRMFSIQWEKDAWHEQKQTGARMLSQSSLVS